MLTRIFKRRLETLKPEDKAEVREVLDATEVETKEIDNKEGETQNMAKEQIVDEKEKSESEETKEVVDNKNEKVEEKEEEISDEKVSEEKSTEEVPEEKEEAVVANVLDTPANGISLDDIVTKDMLTERLAALEAKLETFVKENADLKDKLGEMHDKYEKNDFGAIKAKGLEESGKRTSYEDFDSYSRKFM